MPRHPPQPNKSARHNQKQPTSTQNQLKTINHTGWQSRPSIYNKETTNFVITRHSTDAYTIKPKELKRRPEVNNTKSVQQSNTTPELPNAVEQPTLLKTNKQPKKPNYEICQLSATLNSTRKTGCCTYLFNFVHTKILAFSIPVQSKVQYQKQNCVASSQHIQ